MSTSDAGELEEISVVGGETATPLYGTAQATRTQTERQKSHHETPTLQHSHQSAVRQEGTHKALILRPRKGEAVHFGDSKILIQKRVGPRFTSSVFVRLSSNPGLDNPDLRPKKKKPDFCPNSLSEPQRVETKNSSSQTNMQNASSYTASSSQMPKFKTATTTSLGFERNYPSIPKPFHPKTVSSLIPTVNTLSKTNYSLVSTSSHPELPTAPSPSLLTPPISSPSTITTSSLLTPPATPIITSPIYSETSSPKEGRTLSNSLERDPKKLRSHAEGKRVRRVTWEDSVDLQHSEPVSVEKPDPSGVPTSSLSPQSTRTPSIFSFLRPSSPTTNTSHLCNPTPKTSNIEVGRGGKYRSLSSDSDLASRGRERTKQRPGDTMIFDQGRRESAAPRQERTLSVESGTAQCHSSAPLSLPPDFSSGYMLRYSSPPYSTLVSTRDPSPGRSPNPSGGHPAQFKKSTSSPRSPFSPFASLSPLSPFSSPDVTDDSVFYSPKLQRRREASSPCEPGEGISLVGSRRRRVSTGPPSAGPGPDNERLSSSYADLKYGIVPGRSFSVSSVLSSRPSGPGRISTGSRFMSVGDLSESAFDCRGTGQDLDHGFLTSDWTREYDCGPTSDCRMSYFSSDPGKIRSRSLPRSLTRRLANWSSESSASLPVTATTSKPARLWSPNMNTCHFAWDTEGPPTPPPTPPLSPVSRRISTPSLSSPTLPLPSSSGAPQDSQPSRGHLPSRGYVSSLSTFEESSDSGSDTTTDDEYYLETGEDEEKETEL
eukprot:superscaffoldBa00001368_g10255